MVKKIYVMKIQNGEGIQDTWEWNSENHRYKWTLKNYLTSKNSSILL